MKPASKLAAACFAIVAILHLFRLVFQVRLTVGTVDIPLWVSVPAVLGPGALACWLWRERA